MLKYKYLVAMVTELRKVSDLMDINNIENRLYLSFSSLLSLKGWVWMLVWVSCSIDLDDGYKLVPSASKPCLCN